MAWKIVWSTKAVKTYNANLDYLFKEWTEREVNKFMKSAHDNLQLIEGQPGICFVLNQKKNIRGTLVHKKITLVYRLRPLKREIGLVTFWNNLQDPKRLKFGH